MKKLLAFFLLLALGLGIWGFSFTEPNPDDEKLLMTVLARVLNENHYNKQRIDDNFSAKVFDLFIERMDYNKMYFTEKDIKGFESYRKKLDEDLLNADLSFYHEVMKTFEIRLDEAEKIMGIQLEEGFDFEAKESYEQDPDKRTYAKSEKDLKDNWRKFLKYTVVNSYLGKLENQEKAIEKGADSTGSEYVIKTEEELLASAVEAVKKNMTTRFKRRKEIDEEDNFSIYLNAICASYDPHTQYFPPQEKENFDMRMTGRLEGIGAVLQESDGYIKIASIVTGSACWRQGELEADDLILKVAQADGEPEDIVDAPMKEVLKLIRGPKGTEVRLTVQKKDGGIKVIPIIRDVVIREETYAKSAVIEDKETLIKYGYLYLPTFYSKFGQREGRSSAEDVDRELEKLKLEGVDGIIFDLRNNGGGSLPDAIEMAGLFIKDGPIVQVKTMEQRPQIKSDYNSNITYSGPLIIMINSFSASASEIVAAALQDYNRAYIVGSYSTYGKGTVQTFMDLNNYIKPGVDISQEFGSLKFTVQQFYRVNGSSTQFKGVHSQVEFPDLYDIKEVGESSMEYAIPWDSVPALTYSSWAGQITDFNYLKNQSDRRRSESIAFQRLEDRVKWTRKESKQTDVSLKYEDVKAKREERLKLNKEMKDIQKSNEQLFVKSLQEIQVEGDTVELERIHTWEKQLKKDFYLHETLNIMQDILAMSSAPAVAKEIKD